MATFSQIIFKIACSLADLMGTGLKFCKFDFRNTSVMVFVEKGYKIQPSDEINLAYFQELQQKGQAQIVKGIVDFVDNTPDNDYTTRAATGKMKLNLKHPYQWMFTFDNGLYFHKAITLLESNEQYDVILFDDKGDMLLATDRLGNGKGLDLGILSVGKYVIGNENAQTIMIQVDRTDFDKNVAWIENGNLDFVAAQDLDGYNDVEIVLTAPADAATTVAFTISAKANNKLVPLQGLAKEDLLYQVGGTTTTITTLVTGINPGEYSITVPAVNTADVLTLRLFDSTLNASIINLDGPLYKSNIASTTVI